MFPRIASALESSYTCPFSFFHSFSFLFFFLLHSKIIEDRASNSHSSRCFQGNRSLTDCYQGFLDRMDCQFMASALSFGFDFKRSSYDLLPPLSALDLIEAEIFVVCGF